jgi:aquaporin Z
MRADHWREYLIEAALLGLFMVSACGFTVLLFHPDSPVTGAVRDPFLRRFLIGLAMGATAIALIYSPWGMRSGAHFNPAVTLTFTRLGRMAPGDALAYGAAQFVGGALGVLLSSLVLGDLLSNAAVHYAVTRPGSHGVAAAFLAETVISFILMTVVLEVSNRPRLARLTGIGAGMLVATFITLEAPLSGMSMNPARTVASAVWAGDWTAIWIYFLAPVAGMLAAAQLYLRRRGHDGLSCAKLVHDEDGRCIHCEYRAARPPAVVTLSHSSADAREPSRRDRHYSASHRNATNS